MEEAHHALSTLFIPVWSTLASRMLSGHTGFSQTILNMEIPIWKPYGLAKAVPYIHVTFISKFFFNY